LSGLADPRDCPYVGLDPFEKAYERFFFGRERDSRVIADHVVSRPITVLYGPSGVGKSSVLNVGLPHALRDRAAWIIATLRDWQDPNAIEQRAIEAPRQVPALLRATKRPLLLILDQFEEYFLYRTDNRLTLAEKTLGELLARRNLDLHVLISLREDSLHQLEKLRAIVPGILETTIRLGHLNEADTKQAIRGPIQRYNEIYRKDAAPIEIEDALVDTLIRELRQGVGRPLGDSGGPQRERPIELPYLQLALTKLWEAEGGSNATALRAETLTEKLGGVKQIARDHVDTILNGLTPEEQALCADIFRYLVTGSGAKIAYPTNGLADRVNEDRDGSAAVGADDVAAVLQKLTPTKMRLLKPVKANGADAFELFHDVLGPPVLRWRERGIRRQREDKLLNEQRHEQEKLLEKQRQEQERLFEKQRRVRNALLAAVFGLAACLAVLATGVFYMQTVELREARGRAVWGGLVFAQPQPSLESWDVKALWEVATLDGDKRDGFLAPLTQGYYDRNLVARVMEWAVEWLPWSVHSRDEAKGDDTSVENQFLRRPKTVLRALGLRPFTTDEQAHAAIKAILAALKQTTDPNALKAPAQGLQALAAKLTEGQAQAAIDPVLAAIKQTTDPYALGALAQGLQALPAKLTEAQAQAAIDPVLAAIKQTTDPYALGALAQGLQALDVKVKLPPDQAQNTIGHILTAMEPNASSPNALRALAEALRALGAELNPKQARAAIHHILALMNPKQPTETAGPAPPGFLKALAAALGALPLPAKLDDGQAQDAVKPILAGISQAADPRALQALAPALQAVAAKLTDKQAQPAVEPLLKAITNQAADPDALLVLAQALKALPAELDDAQAKTVIASFLAAIESDQNNFDSALEALAQALQAVAAKLTDEQAQHAAEPLLAAIKPTTSPYALRALAQGLQALEVKVKLPPGQAQNAQSAILEAIRNHAAEPDALQALARALSVLPAKLNDDQTRAAVAAAVDRILEAIKKTTDPAEVKALARALQALTDTPVKLTDPMKDDLVSLARTSLASTGDEETADAWADIFGKLVLRGPIKDRKCLSSLHSDDQKFLHDQQLRCNIVDVLKYPTVAGKPSDTLMANLRKRFPDEKQQLAGDLEATVPWFEWWLGDYEVRRLPDKP
jgi:hypothetical protein